ncbi:hypothetical protein BC937DRAFT_95603, partial [Endogone sp. FLAS-F59071]
ITSVIGRSGLPVTALGCGSVSISPAPKISFLPSSHLGYFTLSKHFTSQTLYRSLAPPSMAIDSVLQHNPNHVPVMHHSEPGRPMVGLPVRPHLIQLDEEKAAGKKPAHKKKKFYLQRDSLAKRNALQMGKEGSRRRNRWDNSKHTESGLAGTWISLLHILAKQSPADECLTYPSNSLRTLLDHFIDHPHAVLRTEDLPSPGYPLDAPKFHWSCDATTGHLTSADLDRLLYADLRRPPPPRPNHPHIRRTVRQELKRSHVPEGTVQKFEAELIEFLERCSKEEGEWIVIEDEMNEEGEVLVTREKEEEDDEEGEESTEEGTMYLVWEIGDKFSRYIVHSMCQYYNLVSFSKTTKGGRRLTYVCHPRYQSQSSDSEESDTDVATSIPPRTFFDYLFLQ